MKNFLTKNIAGFPSEDIVKNLNLITCLLSIFYFSKKIEKKFIKLLKNKIDYKIYYSKPYINSSISKQNYKLKIQSIFVIKLYHYHSTIFLLKDKKKFSRF